MTQHPTKIDYAVIANMLYGPSVTPAALPSIPTVTNDWNPYPSEDPKLVVRAITNVNGSIIAGMNPGIAGSAARGTVRVLANFGGDNTQNSGNLFLAQDTPGNTWPFHLAGRRPWVCIPALGYGMVRLDETDKWHVISVAGVEDMIRSITAASIDPGTILNNWDPVDATTGLPFRFCNHIFVAPSGIGVELNSMRMKSGLGASPPGSSYGYRFSMTNGGSGFVINNNGGGGGTTFRTPGSQPFVVPNLGTTWFWFDFNNDVLWVESCRIGGQ